MQLQRACDTRDLVEVMPDTERIDRDPGVDVRTRAEGQRAVSDVLQLRSEDGEWRVEALTG